MARPMMLLLGMPLRMVLLGVWRARPRRVRGRRLWVLREISPSFIEERSVFALHSARVLWDLGAFQGGFMI